jgi:dimethylargininase
VSRIALKIQFARKYHANARCAGRALGSKDFRVHFSSVLTAITREVSPAIVNCELTFIQRQPIELAKAEQQHRAYERLLEKCGARVITLPAEPALPDSMFVEDPAIVLDELAIIFPLGTESRRAEAASLAHALSKFRKLARIELPGTAEGGDILRVGRRIFAGLSSRTNAEGIRQLGAILAPYGYEVISVEVTGCLHLKSAVTYIGRKQESSSRATSVTLLANRAWFDTKPFTEFEWIDVDPEEPHAANALAIRDTVIFPASFPRTRARIEQRGFPVTPLDISELQKAESGLTCSSLLFDASTD